MSNKEEFRVRWQAADGYAGGSRPHSFSIRSSDLEEDMEEKDLRSLFEEMLQEEFQQNVSPESEDEDAFVEWAKQQVAKKGNQ